MSGKRTLTIAVAVLTLLGCLGAQAGELDNPPLQEVEAMQRLRITINDALAYATLADGTASRDFVSLLPMTLTLEDYNRTEKVGDLPRRLKTKGEPDGFDPSVGDITYYAPWGNLALFYRDFPYARGLVQLGRFDSGVELLDQAGPIKITFELDK
ncbi:MAG: cyclophilin-like fold protein [Paracoccaceae bacterium]